MQRQNMIDIGYGQYMEVFPGRTGRGPVMVQSGYRFYDNYRRNASIFSGVSLIVIGIMSIALNVVEVAHFNGFGNIGHGIWCGITCVLTGGLGIRAGGLRSRCSIISYMVMTIITASLAGIMFLLAIMASIFTCFGWHGGYAHGASCRTWMTLEVCLTCLAALAIIFAAYGSSLTCRVICCIPAHPRLQILSYGNAVPSLPLQSSDVTLTFQEPRHQSAVVERPFIVCDSEPSAPPPYSDLQHLQPPTYDDIMSTQDKK